MPAGACPCEGGILATGSKGTESLFRDADKSAAEAGLKDRLWATGSGSANRDRI